MGRRSSGIESTLDIEIGGETPDLVQLELAASRRSLRLLKERLGLERLLELFAPDIEESDVRWRDLAARSGGEHRTARVGLDVRGLAYPELAAWLASEDGYPALMAANPETYVLAELEGGDGASRIQIRAASGAPTRFLMETVDPSTVPEDPSDPGYPHRRAAVLRLADGTVVCRALHQFSETADGFRAYLANHWPGEAPASLIRDHEESVALQYANFVRIAQEAGATSGPVTTTVTSSSYELQSDLRQAELEASRRALGFLRGRLGADGTQKLLAPLLAESDTRWRQRLAASAGRYRPFEVEVEVRGLSLSAFTRWRKANLDAALIVAGNPEHLAVGVTTPAAWGRRYILEILGGFPSRHFPEAGHASQLPMREQAGEHSRFTVVRLADGTEFMRVLTRFHETPNGFVLRQANYWPVSVPEAVGAAHRDHVVLEYANWFRMATLGRERCTRHSSLRESTTGARRLPRRVSRSSLGGQEWT